STHNRCCSICFLFLIPSQPTPTLFPYTTLFRSPLYWPVDGYFTPGPRQTRFLGCPVTKQHHTLTQILMGLLTRGFALEAVEEARSEEHTSELQSRFDLVCRLLLDKKKI